MIFAKKKIYFKGYYGFKNIGDDIFCIAADWLCNNLWKDKTQIFIGGRLPFVSNNAKKIEISNRFYKKIYEFFICIKVNYIIYFGGSLLSRRIFGFRDIKYYLEKYHIFYKKLGAIGISIGPFKNKDDYYSIKKFLSKFKFIAVRDYSSLKIAIEMNLKSKVSFCFDIALLITDIFPSLKKKKRGYKDKVKIAVSLCHYERYNGGSLSKEKERESAVLNLIERIILENRNVEEIVFFQFNGSKNNGDIKIIQEFNDIINDKINTRIVYYNSDTEEFCKQLNKCDFLIGMRLHSGILAYSLNIPFILVEYHNKCTEFLNTINDKYRFDIKNQNININNFNKLIGNGFIPGIKNPNYFKNILIKELKKINELL
jgi:polysaccharide pyruvyl transferase WcaK-like protein